MSLSKKIGKIVRTPIAIALFIVPVFGVYNFYRTSLQNNYDPRTVHAVALSNEDLQSSKDNPIGVFDHAVISIGFDDGWVSIYDDGFKILEELDINTTQYVLTGYDHNFAYIRRDQLEAMKKAGHDIASHSHSHRDLTKISAEDLEAELQASRHHLEEQYGHIDDFASPYGAYNDDVVNTIKKLYRSHRTTQPGVNTRDTFDAYRLKAKTIDLNTTDQEIRDLIEQAKREKGWVIFTYHQVDDSNKEYAVDKDRLRKQLLIMKESGVPIATTDQVLDEIYWRFNQ